MEKLSWEQIVANNKKEEPINKQSDARTEVGDGKLPNKYWVSTSSNFYVQGEGNFMDNAGDVLDVKDSGHTIEPPFATFAEAMAKAEEIIQSEIGPEPTNDGINSVMIEDRLSGKVFEGAWEAYKTKGLLPGYKYEFERSEDTGFTKSKMQEMGAEFK